MKIVNHKLQEAIWKPSPNYEGIIDPCLVVIHYTNTDRITSPLNWLRDPKSKVSAHLLIGKDGKIYQLVPFNRKAWHAGVSEWDGIPRVNNFSIGIELVGKGRVFPQKQLEVLFAALDVIIKKYAVVDFVGHDQVARPKGRRSDPGPNFPWRLIRERYE